MRNSSKVLMTILGVILLFLSSCSNETPIPLWEVTNENLPQSYIVGTIEFLDKEKGKELLNSKLNKAFEESETYVSQANEKDSDILLTMKVLEIGMDRYLKNILSEADFNKLVGMKNDWDAVTKNNIETPDSVRIKLIMYLQDIIFYNNQDNFIFHHHWLKQAMPMRKNITGLETWQDGFKSLAEVPFEDQLKFMHSIVDFDKFRNEVRSKTQELYAKGEYLELKNFYNIKFPFLKNYNETLVQEKHKVWADKLSAGMDTSSCFISLDVTHLVGEDNLIDELLSKGYKVSKIQ